MWYFPCTLNKRPIVYRMLELPWLVPHFVYKWCPGNGNSSAPLGFVRFSQCLALSCHLQCSLHIASWGLSSGLWWGSSSIWYLYQRKKTFMFWSYWVSVRLFIKWTVFVTIYAKGSEIYEINFPASILATLYPGAFLQFMIGLITTLIVTFLICCMLEVRCCYAGFSGLQVKPRALACSPETPT